jgi:hypothetical protein
VIVAALELTRWLDRSQGARLISAAQVPLTGKPAHLQGLVPAMRQSYAAEGALSEARDLFSSLGYGPAMAQTEVN